jgi:hypothetical protein
MNMSIIRLAISTIVLSLVLVAGHARADEEKEKPAVKAESAWKVGDKVDVEWNSDWYAGVIVEVKERSHYRVHYVGFDKGWDKDVHKSQIRARTADSRKGTKKDDAT